ncbi:PREDICTED: uncharacterized protein K02A2.6-like [Trachymyrmex cornetzi]|uniref:uncharacterized protein K02A2.6-like n=1 Tax=Trachymyrmex cornetzi TaxID=471704 RepID=UPI00084F09F8|nr:PREDICTED: uncharacterized protein K02A2.6-like [Trachymyrmex cornetzi]
MEWRKRIATDVIYVVKEGMQPLLDRTAIKTLDMLEWIIDTVIAEISNVKPEEEFSKVFQGLGCYKKCKPYHICLKSNTQPYAVSAPRRVPLHLTQRAKEELQRLEEMGVISRVVEPTPWCAPMVAVLKANKKDVRICVDYTELNKGVVRSRHIMPSIEENLAQLGGARWFSLLDANKGYHQMSICHCCRLLTTFITPCGRFCFNRLPMGLCPSAEHFQENMSKVLSGLRNVVNLSDDILIYGKTLEEHDECLRAALRHLSDAGITLSREKCVLRQRRVKFLGYVVSAEHGVEPDPEKIKAIVEMSRPTNATEVKRLLGMIHFQLKFIKHLADITRPLHSSSYGLGAVLEQYDKNQECWRPVYYASRALSETEKRYAQIEKEALALTWACEKFATFIEGDQDLIRRTDHKPLISILGSKPIRKTLVTADTLSRAPISDILDICDCMHEENAEKYVHTVVKRRASDPFSNKIYEMQQQDPTMQEVLKHVKEGWPRVHIPKGLREEVLKRIHQGHLGEKKCLGRARQAVWWPGISTDVKAKCTNCNTCLEYRPQIREPLITVEPPERLWQEVAVDFCDRDGRQYLVLVDCFSRYPEVVHMTSTTTTKTVAKMKDIFGRHGIPERVRSDNGPQFSSQEYKEFARNFGFTSVTNSPRYPQSNGKVEAAVKAVKRILKETEPTLGLLAYSTSLLETGSSPCELLMGRKLRTTILSSGAMLTPGWPDLEAHRQQMRARQLDSKQQYDRRHRTRELPELKPGELVWIRDQRTYGTVMRRRSEPRSYDVRYPGGVLRRNRIFLTAVRREVDDEDDDDIAWSSEAEAPKVTDKEVESIRQPELPRRSSRQHHSSKRLQYQALGVPS